VQASRLLRNAKVRTAVKEEMQARSRRTGITADRVVLELEKLAFSNIFDFIEVHTDGSVHIDLLRATRDRAAAIHEVTVRGSSEGSRQ
jgi:phage terminase small subunit